MHPNLKLQGATFHLRRRVPKQIYPTLLRQEIVCTLRTQIQAPTLGPDANNEPLRSNFTQCAHHLELGSRSKMLTTRSLEPGLPVEPTASSVREFFLRFQLPLHEVPML